MWGAHPGEPVGITGMWCLGLDFMYALNSVSKYTQASFPHHPLPPPAKKMGRQITPAELGQLWANELQLDTQ